MLRIVLWVSRLRRNVSKDFNRQGFGGDYTEQFRKRHYREHDM
jgi:hypothetical protein